MGGLTATRWRRGWLWAAFLVLGALGVAIGLQHAPAAGTRHEPKPDPRPAGASNARQAGDGGGKVLNVNDDVRLEALRRRAGALPEGPVAMKVKVRSGETLELLAKWSGLPASRIARRSALAPGQQPRAGDHVVLDLTAEQYERFDRARREFWARRRAEFEARCERVRTVVHHVQRGDTLWKLRRLGNCVVPVWLIEDENPGVDLSRLIVGQELRVPQYRTRTRPLRQPVAHARRRPLPALVTPRVPGIRRVVVQPGDTLWTISRREGVSQADLIRLNGLSNPDTLRPGQTLVLPAGRRGDVHAPGSPTGRNRNAHRDSLARAQQEAKGPHVPNEAATKVRIVRPGETAWGIAQRLGVSLHVLHTLNPRVDLDRLRAGQRLVVPATSSPSPD